MHSLQELKPLILQWAKEKDLLKHENADKQRLKLLEEVGETAQAILKSDKEKCKDGVGDIFVVLIILYAQLDIEFDFDVEPLEKYEELSEQDRLMTLLYYHDAVGFDQLHYFCQENELDLVECANIAWNEIKNRTGKTVGGTFIKD
jgi:NTP pyrophosphatase (non-canonical NTP hydrolase)